MPDLSAKSQAKVGPKRDERKMKNTAKEVPAVYGAAAKSGGALNSDSEGKVGKKMLSDQKGNNG